MPERQSDGETERWGDGEAGRRRDKGKMRSHLTVSLSLCRLVAPPLRLPISLSLRLSVSLSLCLFVSVAGSIQTESFEKKALALAKELPASDLDAELPSRSLGYWLEQVFGSKAGMVWQLAECGEPIIVADETDMPACAEINAVLPDRRRVFVAIRVGTFKKGLTGKPSFVSAVVEQNTRLYQVRRLSELPAMLRASDLLSNKGAPTKTKNVIADLPRINVGATKIIPPSHNPSPLLQNLPDALSQGKTETPPPPPPISTPITPPSMREPVKVSESALKSRAITKVKPVYPPIARNLNAIGTVEVEVIVSEEGLVVDAMAISGHYALRGAAVDAARKWVFKPATFDGSPVRVKSVLTFVFTPGDK
jgi:TonB family protein